MVLDKIRELCVAKGTTVSKLEKDLEFGNGTIQKWDRSSPSADKLQRVADYFNVSLDFLVGRINQTADSQIVAGIFNTLSVGKQSLIKQYISVIQHD